MITLDKKIQFVSNKQTKDILLTDVSDTLVILPLVSISSKTSVSIEHIYDLNIEVVSRLTHPSNKNIYKSDIVLKNIMLKGIASESLLEVNIKIFNQFKDLPDIIDAFKYYYFDKQKNDISEDGEYYKLLSYYFYNLFLISNYLNSYHGYPENNQDNKILLSVLSVFWHKLKSLNDEIILFIQKYRNFVLNTYTVDLIDSSISYLTLYNSYFEDLVYKHKIIDFPVELRVNLNEHQKNYLMYQTINDVLVYARSSNNDDLKNILNRNYINVYGLLDESTFKL